MRRALVGTFVGVVAALTTVGGALAIAVHGPLRALEAIADDHGRAVQLTAQIRSSLSEARRAVLAGVSGPGGGAAPVRASTGYAAIEEPLRELSAVCTTPFEADRLEVLRAAVARSAAESDAIERSLASGDSDGARDHVAAFLEVSGQANDAADAILGFNAVEVEQASHQVRRGISGLAIAMLVLSVVAAAGGYVLLRFALRGLEAHEATWHARFSDVDAFAARAAHELRTPLHTLRLALASGKTQALDRARRSADRMSGTIEALLEFARSGGGPGADALAEVGRVVSEVLEELVPLIEKQRAVVTVEVAAGARVGMAPEHLRTIVRNLVVNALRYGAVRAGGRVAIRSRVEGSRVHLEVADEGPGIPPSALPHVFEPFARGTESPGGFGIGLATVRRLVEAHGGAVALESVPGRGTTVRVTLRTP